ncbi:hypothetical protein AB0L13_47540 [Saccharopolyspora shandongensis]|uniref:hypothetical protein n=1 Tax=Saccharopolyspora shandongensis TaxID=418495 RepID=UPI0034420992
MSLAAQDSTVADARIAFCGVGATPVRASTAEQPWWAVMPARWTGRRNVGGCWPPFCPR